MKITDGDYTLQVEIPEDLRQGDIERYFAADREMQQGRADREVIELAVDFVRGLRSAKVKLRDEQFQTLSREVLNQTARNRLAVSVPERNGNTVRILVRCGWVAGIAEDEVGELHPPTITRLAEMWNEAFVAAHEVPGE
jgi:hypothetical protein